ncbi:MAG: hypothetical protein E7660_05450 [Ruminococcaceae bacterium]|nr:hypothetical protein [Oscillospiraceae bacterium]
MNVLAYILAFIGITVILALGGVICESEALGEKLLKARKVASAVLRGALLVLMLPAYIVFRAATFVGFIEN